MVMELSWDEFRLVKAIADTRSLTGAAERLGLNHSTVFRRLAALEKSVGSQLFERSRAGYEATPAGSEMAAVASGMADSIVKFQRNVVGRDAEPTGLLQVTTGELVGQCFLPAIMATFRARYPGVFVELTLTDRVLNLAQREADVAIRLTNDPPETLVGRRLCAMRWAIYCRHDLVDDPDPPDIDSIPFIGLGDGFGESTTRRWLDSHVRPAKLAAKVNSVQSMLELVRHGFGAAPLPCFLGEQEPTLTRIGPPPDDLNLGVWILTHADLRRSARVRTFMDLAGAELVKLRAALEGASIEGEAAVGESLVSG
jgi:DNA-binding transcriptional LysR family regulator